MFTILFLGFLIGMQHAMEADHIAAVSSLATGTGGRRGIVCHGVVWGIGHASSLSDLGPKFCDERFSGVFSWVRPGGGGTADFRPR